MSKNYPNRSLRNCTIAEISSGLRENGVVAGRVIGILDGEGEMPGFDNSKRGYLLQDESGRVLVLAENFPNVGNIIEVEVRGAAEGVKEIGEKTVLAACEDFYIGAGAPNFLKMIIDEGLRDKLRKRGEIIEEIRRFFMARGFLEIDTPSLVRYPGQEPYLDVFKTEFSARHEGEEIHDDLYLITSPEYSLKKYLAGGFEKIFQIGKSFRNKETFSKLHNPEFTMLEWYRAYASYLEIMDDTEELVKYLFEKFAPDWPQILEKWDRMTVEEVFQKFANSEVPENEEEFFELFLNQIEPHLGIEKPVIIYDYPISMAALSKRSESGEVAERFEVYIAGMEICNAFSELNDPREQADRLNKEKSQRGKMGKEVYDVDPKFIDALKMGMPPSGGNALGVDRLIMLLLKENSIEKILPFPYKDL